MIFWWPGTEALLAASILAPVPAVTADAKPKVAISGIFSNVQLSPETGDMGGLEIEFHTDTPEPYALVVFCEGWCNQAHRVPVDLSGRRFSLSFSESLTDSSGSPVAQEQYRVEGRLEDRSLIANLRLNNYSWRSTLTPIATRFGLDVALTPAEDGQPLREKRSE